MCEAVEKALDAEFHHGAEPPSITSHSSTLRTSLQLELERLKQRLLYQYEVRFVREQLLQDRGFDLPTWKQEVDELVANQKDVASRVLVEQEERKAKHQAERVVVGPEVVVEQDVLVEQRDKKHDDPDHHGTVDDKDRELEEMKDHLKPPLLHVAATTPSTTTTTPTSELLLGENYGTSCNQALSTAAAAALQSVEGETVVPEVQVDGEAAAPPEQQLRQPLTIPIPEADEEVLSGGNAAIVGQLRTTTSKAADHA
ncbi:unnamed protein product, partial [Amoebophrya sp. A120]|eukprot:GSA120T00009080001.1